MHIKEKKRCLSYTHKIFLIPRSPFSPGKQYCRQCTVTLKQCSQVKQPNFWCSSCMLRHIDNYVHKNSAQLSLAILCPSGIYVKGSIPPEKRNLRVKSKHTEGWITKQNVIMGLEIYGKKFIQSIKKKKKNRKHSIKL